MQHASSVRAFIRHHYRHFNAAALIDAAEGYVQHIDKGGQMFLAMAGAMSSAELGLSLAEMIRAGQDPRHLLHRGQPGGRCLQPGGPRPLCARAQLA